MTIEQLDTSKVLISLGSEDMRDYELRFNDMSFCDEHSRRVLLRLLKLACMKTGVPYSSKTVLMEALPHSSGCLLLVTLMEKSTRKTYKVKRIKEHPCYVFLSAEDLLSAVESLHQRALNLHKNSLWLCGGKYYLVFDYPVVNCLARGVLCEYSREIHSSAVALSRIRESGKLLCSDNAVEIIANKLCS